MSKNSYRSNDEKYYLYNCLGRLQISNTSFLEIKKRLGYKQINEAAYEKIETIVNDIKRRYGRVTLSTIKQYWEHMYGRN